MLQTLPERSHAPRTRTDAPSVPYPTTRTLPVETRSHRATLRATAATLTFVAGAAGLLFALSTVEVLPQQLVLALSVVSLAVGLRIAGGPPVSHRN